MKMKETPTMLSEIWSETYESMKREMGAGSRRGCHNPGESWLSVWSYDQKKCIHCIGGFSVDDALCLTLVTYLLAEPGYSA